MTPIEVWPRLFVGNQNSSINGFDFIVQAAKEPWHRDALGYKGAAAPKDHPEYLSAYRDNRLILNLVDPNTSAFIPEKLMSQARIDIAQKLALDKKDKILIQCNKGESRAPSIALSFMFNWTRWATDGGFFSHGPLKVMTEFKKIYPLFNPSKGFTEYLNAFLQTEAD